MLGDVKLILWQSTRAAIRYAKAILDLAQSKGCWKVSMIWILSLQL
jgi:hypothetical protein